MMPLINTFDPSVAVNTGTDIITINGHGFIDRQGVIYHTGGGTAVGALVDGYKYYIISVSINTFKLALTEENAGDSIAVDLLSVGSGSLHSFETSNIYPNSAAYYDFFRKVRLLGNGTDPGGNTLEADSVRDNMTIVAGDNIVFEISAKNKILLQFPDLNTTLKYQWAQQNCDYTDELVLLSLTIKVSDSQLTAVLILLVSATPNYDLKGLALQKLIRFIL